MSKFSSGNWVGGAYASNQTGRFSHCAISARYASGNTLLFSVNRDASISVAVSGPLGLTRGQQFPVTLYVDQRRPFYGTAEATSPNFARLTIRDFSAALTAFKKGYVLRIKALGGYTRYGLKGTFRALEKARKCAVSHYAYVAAPKAVDKSEMYQLSTMIIADLGLDKFRYLNNQELRERGWENAVAWSAKKSGVAGLSLIVSAARDTDLRSTDAADIQFIARDCGGDYATSARSISLENSGRTARELRLICTDGNQTAEVFLSKFLQGNRLVYTVLMFKKREAKLSANAPRPKQIESATIRAANFMSR